eukprot:CAMPEP_0172191710 /NCGR_PEP_ID=MMETSP1050-20130122/23878_1 /TAXON_ID=233186 /ORGANISM="Cryptomonas curvata, Strain CCAP979/52" /LENGTH=68 /DNA_ID=CAMNT_0012866841 /DNA_START=18 /DNA_END=225 /DNA_ORIENTATION=-
MKLCAVVSKSAGISYARHMGFIGLWSTWPVSHGIAFNAPLARPTPEDVPDSKRELDGLRLKFEGLRLY